MENTSWKTPKYGLTCADYAKNKWCENGGKGSAWNENWPWDTDSFGLDARSVCCICGRNTKSGKSLCNLKNYETNQKSLLHVFFSDLQH